jgi:restriction endonuclease Mrr
MAHHKIILINGKLLVDLLYKFGVGVQVANKYSVKETDKDYFI